MSLSPLWCVSQIFRHPLAWDPVRWCGSAFCSGYLERRLFGFQGHVGVAHDLKEDTILITIRLGCHEAKFRMMPVDYRREHPTRRPGYLDAALEPTAAALREIVAAEAAYAMATLHLPEGLS